jgi:alpha-beta hydrolase superfamily lysophospholipase
MRIDNLRSSPKPASSYAEAVKRIGAMQAKDTAEVNPLCRTQFLTHGDKAARAIVTMHGLSNCPYGGHELAPFFFDHGYNVLIPRIPHNGLADRLTTDLANLTAEELVAITDESIDIAHGLGNHVTFFGISLGGTMAAWAAQNRSDLDLAAIVAPGLRFKLVPGFLTRPLVTLALSLPNIFIWWDPRFKERIPGPQYAYPRFSTRGLAQGLRMAFATRSQARNSKPAARSILVITNANDLAVDNKAAAELVQTWRRNGAQNVNTFEFEKHLNLLHDLISPEQIGQRTNVVYPVLVDLVARQYAGGC